METERKTGEEMYFDPPSVPPTSGLVEEGGTMMAVELDDLLNALLHEWADGFDRLNEFEQLFGESVSATRT